jgi:hypothetical protein
VAATGSVPVPYHAGMRNRTGALELGLLVALFTVVARFVAEPLVWVAAALIIVATAAGTAGLLGRTVPWRWPVDGVALPALAAFASVGIGRLVEPVPWLEVVAVAALFVVGWVVGLELRRAALAEASAVEPDLVEEAAGPSPAGRLAAFGLVFAGLAAIGGLVPGGVAGEGQTVTPVAFLATILLDVAIALVAGYRIVALRPHTRNDVFVALYLYLLAIAPLGVLIRVLALPRLFGPAVLTLAFYIVTSLHESEVPLRRNARLLEETAILALAGGLVMVVGLLVR